MLTRKIVIGEGMDAVKEVANRYGAGYYSPWKKYLKKQNLQMKLKRNERWIKDEIKKGSEFLDIGIDPQKRERSQFYKMEKRVIREKKYQKIKPIKRPVL